MGALRFLLWCIARFVLSLRYRIRLHGADQARALEGPLLVLPNHPAYIDPAIVLGWLWRELRPRPVLYEGLFLHPGYFQTPVAYPLIRFLGDVEDLRN